MKGLSVEQHAPGLDAPERPSKAQLGQVRQLLEHTSQQIGALPLKAIRSLAPVLYQAQQELAHDLARWVRTVKDGDLRYTAQMYRGTLLHITAALTAVRKIAPEMVKQIEMASTEKAGHGLHDMTTEFARLSQVFDGTAQHIALQTASVLAEGNRFLIPRYESSAARYVENVQTDIRRELAVGMVRGETVNQMVDRLARHGGPRGLVLMEGNRTEQIAEGLFTRYRWWAERVVRTEVASAANYVVGLGIGKLHLEDRGIERRWDASLDRRVCPLCFALDNTTAPVNGSFDGGITDAPAHPCCRCRVGAWRAEWKPWLDELDIELKAERAEADAERAQARRARLN